MKKYMQRIVLIFTVIAICCLMLPVASATETSYFPQSGGNDKVTLELCNLSEINSMTAQDAAFKLTFEPIGNKVQVYTVEYGVDSGKTAKMNIEINPSNREKTIKINAGNGVHTLSVAVSKNGTLIKNFTEKILIMDLYTRHFMDEFSVRGINTSDDLKADNDLILNYLKYSGWRLVRGVSTLWQNTEKSKGVYNFNEAQKKLNKIKSIGVQPLFMLYQGNGFLYPAQEGVDSWKNDNKTIVAYIPQTKESLEGFARFSEASAYFSERNGIDYWHIWNEGDLGSQAGTIYSRTQCYADVVKSAMIRNLYNGKDIEYGLFVGTNNMVFYDYGYDCGLYPYSSVMDHHIYKSSGGNYGFDEDRIYETDLAKYEEVIIKHGGWKDKSQTETGYTTPKAANYPSEEEAAENIAKVYAACELNDYETVAVYNMINTGVDAAYTEHNFGQINRDLTPKKSYPATVAFNNMTEGGICIGELDFGDDKATRAIVYYRDGEPIVMAWSYEDDGSYVEWKPEGQTFDVYDHMGNKVASEQSSVMLQNPTTYLLGFTKDIITEAVDFEVQKRSDDWKTRYNDVVSEKIKNEFADAIDAARADLTGIPTAETIEKHMDALGGIADEIISDCKDGKLSELEASQTIYGIYRIIQRLNGLYISIYDGDIPQDISGESEKAEKKADVLYRNDLASMQFSDEMRRHAKRYSDKVNAILKMGDNPSKAGVVKGYNYMEELLCRWFNKFTEFESRINLGYQIQSSYFDRESYVNSNITTPYRIWNYSKKSFSGHLEVCDSKGNVLAKTNDFTFSGNGGYKEFPITIKTERPEDGSGIAIYDVRLVNKQGEVVTEQKTCYEIKDKFIVTSEAITSPIESVSSIPINIENVTDEKQTAHLMVESDENMTFSKNEYEVSIDAKSSVTVNIPVSDIKETEFHYYSFNYKVMDDSKNVVVDAKKLLNFTTIVKASSPIDIAAYDGDISSWSDAYPIYINEPLNPTDKSNWEEAECSARMLAKWDENNLYLLVDIYDERHLQEYQGEKIWQGDSLQISIDPLNNGSMLTTDKTHRTYNTDDYELGFAYTANGNEFYSWQSPNNLQGGPVDWFKMVRDGKFNCTRYMIKIDSSMIENLTMKDNFAFGFNICINDADILGRENFYQYTKGTGDTKNPDYYADFTFSTAKQGEMVQSKANELFPLQIDNDLE